VEIALSVMDQSPIPEGSTAAQALADTLALAGAADRLGYRRFWLAEHHNTASLAGTAPEVLAACVASRTTSLRVGSGGVLLSHYSPLKVAETFRVLEALFPGRIDLGLGRADGADPAAVAALQRGRPASPDDEYPEQVAELVAFLDDTVAGVQAMPAGVGSPEVWVLSSSSYGADLAARMGLPLCFAHFVSPRFGSRVTAGYFRAFRPSKRCPEPRASLGVSVLCAATDDHAERLAASADVWHLRREGPGRGPLLSWRQAADYPATELEAELLAQQRDRRIVGAPDRVHAVLTQMAADYRVDELVVRTVCHDPADRLRSYQLLAEVFSLTPPSAHAPATAAQDR
jgi:luciferase family oxidoreductase group 1